MARRRWRWRLVVAFCFTVGGVSYAIGAWHVRQSTAAAYEVAGAELRAQQQQLSSALRHIVDSLLRMAPDSTFVCVPRPDELACDWIAREGP